MRALIAIGLIVAVTTLPGQATAGIDLRELTSWKTPPNDIFVVTHYNVPIIDAASWRLQIDGLAGRPMTLTLDDLKRRPRVERTVTFECGGNREAVLHRMVGNATDFYVVALPKERPLVYFLTATDERGAVISTENETLEK